MNCLIALVALAGGSHAEPVPVLGQEGALSAKVTFEARAASADRVLEALSEACGTRLTCSTAVAKEVLAVKVREAPLSELMDRIATAASAVWRREGSSYRLIRTQEIEKREREAHFQARLEAIRKAQEALRERIAKLPPFDTEEARQIGIQAQVLVDRARQERENLGQSFWNQQQALGDRLPSGRLAMRLAALLDPAILASELGPTKIAFSLRPNRMQKPLPKQAEHALAEFARESAVMLDAQPQRPNADDVYSFGPALFNYFRPVQTADASPARLVVQARSWSWAGHSYSVTAYVANSSGRILAEPEFTLQSEQAAPGGASVPAAKQGEPDIELSPLSKELSEKIRRLVDSSNFAGRPALSPGLKEVFLHPESRDVGELVATDAAFAIANSNGTNLVACLTDVFSLYSVWMLGTGTVKPSQVSSELGSTRTGMSERTVGGWTLLRPARPYESRLQKADRAALGRLLREAAQMDRVSIDAMAQYALTCQLDPDQTIAIPLLMVVAPEGSRDVGNSNWETLKLHGSLTPGQRRVLASGGRLQYPQLSPMQKALVERIVYVTGDMIHEARGAQPMYDGDTRIYSHHTLLRLPTERFPDGLPIGTALRLSVRSETALYLKGTLDGRPASRETTPEGYAYRLFELESPRGQSWEQKWEFTEFRCGEKTTYDYAIELGEGRELGLRLSESGSKSAPVSSHEKLPPEVLAKIQAQLKTLRDAAKKNPPPPGRLAP